MAWSVERRAEALNGFVRMGGDFAWELAEAANRYGIPLSCNRELAYCVIKLPYDADYDVKADYYCRVVLHRIREREKAAREKEIESEVERRVAAELKKRGL